MAQGSVLGFQRLDTALKRRERPGVFVCCGSRPDMLWTIGTPGLDREHNGALGMPRVIGLHQLRHEFSVLFKNDGTSEQFEIDGMTNIDGTAQIEISELPTCPLLTVEGYCVRIRDQYPGNGW